MDERIGSRRREETFNIFDNRYRVGDNSNLKTGDGREGTAMVELFLC